MNGARARRCGAAGAASEMLGDHARETGSPPLRRHCTALLGENLDVLLGIGEQILQEQDDLAELDDAGDDDVHRERERLADESEHRHRSRGRPSS